MSETLSGVYKWNNCMVHMSFEAWDDISCQCGNHYACHVKCVHEPNDAMTHYAMRMFIILLLFLK